MSVKFSEEELELRNTLKRSFRSQFMGSVTERIERASVDGFVKVQQSFDELGLIEYFQSDQEPLAEIVRQYLVCSEETGFYLLPFAPAEYLFCQGLLPRLVDGDLVSEALVGSPVVACYSKMPVSSKNSQVSFKGAPAVTSPVRFLLVAPDSCALTKKAGVLPGKLSETPDFDLLCSRVGGTLNQKELTLISESEATIVRATLGLGLSGELYGMGHRVFELTAEYVKTREQFGLPVGGFQAVQHKLVDCFVKLEALRSLNWLAAVKFSTEDPAEFSLASLSALSLATGDIPGIVETAIQLHGGIGFTFEHELHLYLRRARVYKSMLSALVDSDRLIELAALHAKGGI